VSAPPANAVPPTSRAATQATTDHARFLRAVIARIALRTSLAIPPPTLPSQRGELGEARPSFMLPPLRRAQRVYEKVLGIWRSRDGLSCRVGFSLPMSRGRQAEAYPTSVQRASRTRSQREGFFGRALRCEAPGPRPPSRRGETGGSFRGEAAPARQTPPAPPSQGGGDRKTPPPDLAKGGAGG